MKRPAPEFMREPRIEDMDEPPGVWGVVVSWLLFAIATVVAGWVLAVRLAEWFT